jgi:predicted methyltransferase
VLEQFHRVLRPGGVLAVGFHVGEKPDGYADRRKPTDSYLRPPSQVADWLRDTGFTVEAQHLLRPDDPSPGAILFARRPEAPR